MDTSPSPPRGKGKLTKSPENIRKGGEGRVLREGKKEKENMRKWDAQEGGRTVQERKERDTLIEGAIKGLERNLA